MVIKKVIAIVPARGGSKRIANKNIIRFSGRPMLAWTLKAARETNLFDRILVSTDDPKIAAVAISDGFEIPFLRVRANDDVTPVSEATLAALQQCRDILSEEYINVVQLLPNCPLRGADEISKAYHHFIENDLSFQISCFKFGWMNPWWAFILDENNMPHSLYPDALKKRSQDLPPVYCPTGAIWIARVDSLRHAGTFYGPNHQFYPMPWESAVDIDDYDDLLFAETLAKCKRGSVEGHIQD
jgi:CMP-N-acetylneuraminic acid synthetase